MILARHGKSESAAYDIAAVCLVLYPGGEASASLFKAHQSSSA